MMSRMSRMKLFMRDGLKRWDRVGLFDIRGFGRIRLMMRRRFLLNGRKRVPLRMSRKYERLGNRRNRQYGRMRWRKFYGFMNLMSGLKRYRNHFLRHRRLGLNINVLHLRNGYDFGRTNYPYVYF